MIKKLLQWLIYDIIDWRLCCGRYWLVACNSYVTMETDKCRDGQYAESNWQGHTLKRIADHGRLMLLQRYIVAILGGFIVGYLLAIAICLLVIL